MASPATDLATKAIETSQQSHPITVYHAKLANPHLIGDLVRKDTSVGYGEVKLSQLSALQHHTAKVEGNQVQLPKVPVIIAEFDTGLHTRRVAVPAPQQPAANQSYSMAVFTWTGDGLPPAKLVDVIRSELPTRSLHRGMIEKRVWAKKLSESDRHRWRLVGITVYRTSDFSTEHMKQWEEEVSRQLGALAVGVPQQSFKLRQLQVEVTSTTADLQSVNGNESLQRPTRGLIGNAVFDTNAQNTITDKGLTLCFGEIDSPRYNVKLAGQPTQSHVPKLFFATGAVSDFLLARLPASQLVDIEQGSQLALDTMHAIKSYLRGLEVVYIDKTGRDCVRAVVDIGESPAPMGTILVTGGDATLLGHPQLPLINVGSPYTGKRPHKVEWMDQMMLRHRATADLVAKQVQAAAAKVPVDAKLVSDINMAWTDSVRNALHTCTSAAEMVLPMKVEQIVGKAGDWKFSLRGFIAEQESAMKFDQYAVVVFCLPAKLALQKGQHDPYQVLKAFCEINLGLNSFCVNEATLQSARADRRDTLRSVDAPPKPTPFGDHDRPMDLTVAVHLTLITPQRSKQHTHILLAVVSRDYASSKQYSTFIQLYEKSDKVAMRVQLAQHLHDLSQRHAERWTSQKLTIIRSGDWLDDARDELDQLMAGFDDDARKAVEFSQMTVCKDSKFNGLIDADAVSSVRHRETAALPDAPSTGVFYLTQNDGPEAALKPALYVSQAQCAPQLKFIKAQIIRGSLGYSPQATEDLTAVAANTGTAVLDNPAPATRSSEPRNDIDAVTSASPTCYHRSRVDTVCG
nr:hypothetical protein B0A51_08362 [Rachicladosporium sp. CCFEE 5018]